MGLAVLIAADNFQLLTERKVLKQAEYTSTLDAAALLDASRGEARRIVRDTAQHAEESRRKGYEDGLALAASEYAQRLMTGAAESERQLRSLRTSIANIVVKAASRLLADVEPAKLLEASLLKAEELIRNEAFVTLRIHPSQEEMVTQVLDGLRQRSRWTINVALAPDPTLRHDACVLQTASGRLELGTEAQVAAMRQLVERDSPRRHG